MYERVENCREVEGGRADVGREFAEGGKSASRRAVGRGNNESSGQMLGLTNLTWLAMNVPSADQI